MITQYGMSEKFGLMGLESASNQYLEGRTVLNCSDVTAAEVDKEVMRVLKESYEEAKRLLTEHRHTLDKIAEFLIERETITGKEFMDIFHQVEGTSEDTTRSETRIQEKAVENPEAEAGKIIALPSDGNVVVPEETVKPEEKAEEAVKPEEKAEEAKNPEEKTEK